MLLLADRTTHAEDGSVPPGSETQDPLGGGGDPFAFLIPEAPLPLSDGQSSQDPVSQPEPPPQDEAPAPPNEPAPPAESQVPPQPAVAPTETPVTAVDPPGSPVLVANAVAPPQPPSNPAPPEGGATPPPPTPTTPAPAPVVIDPNPGPILAPPATSTVQPLFQSIPVDTSDPNIEWGYSSNVTLEPFVLPETAIAPSVAEPPSPTEQAAPSVTPVPAAPVLVPSHLPENFADGPIDPAYTDALQPTLLPSLDLLDPEATTAAVVTQPEFRFVATPMSPELTAALYDYGSSRKPLRIGNAFIDLNPSEAWLAGGEATSVTVNPATTRPAAGSSATAAPSAPAPQAGRPAVQFTPVPNPLLMQPSRPFVFNYSIWDALGDAGNAVVRFIEPTEFARQLATFKATPSLEGFGFAALSQIPSAINNWEISHNWKFVVSSGPFSFLRDSTLALLYRDKLSENPFKDFVIKVALNEAVFLGSDQVAKWLTSAMYASPIGAAARANGISFALDPRFIKPVALLAIPAIHGGNLLKTAFFIPAGLMQPMSQYNGSNPSLTMYNRDMWYDAWLTCAALWSLNFVKPGLGTTACRNGMVQTVGSRLLFNSPRDTNLIDIITSQCPNVDDEFIDVAMKLMHCRLKDYPKPPTAGPSAKPAPAAAPSTKPRPTTRRTTPQVNPAPTRTVATPAAIPSATKPASSVNTQSGPKPVVRPHTRPSTQPRPLSAPAIPPPATPKPTPKPHVPQPVPQPAPRPVPKPGSAPSGGFQFPAPAVDPATALWIMAPLPALGYWLWTNPHGVPMPSLIQYY
jgi:hypothetical protein